MLEHIFNIAIDGIQFDTSVQFKEISERYRNCELKNQSHSNFLLSVKKRETNPIEISIREAKTEANNLLDKLVLLPNHNIRSVKYQGYIKRGILHTEKINSVKISSLSGIIKNPMEYYKKPEHLQLLEKEDSGLVRVYRSALEIEDKLSQYIIFYGILLILKGEVQKNVDSFIEEKIPDILFVKGKYRNETIITSLRNKIGHPNNNIDMIKVNQEIQTYSVVLKELVLGELKK